MDSILLLGVENPATIKMLTRLGYCALTPTPEQSLHQIGSSGPIDLIILDEELGDQNLGDFFRTEAAFRDVPILYLSKQVEAPAWSNGLENVEVIAKPYSTASLLSGISVQLRLRKLGAVDNNRASLAEKNALLRDLNNKFVSQLEEARGIQEGLLPKTLPQDSRFELAAAYEPLEEVGGDWYDVAILDNGELFIQVADVTGHGLSAALIGSMTKLARVAVNENQPEIQMGKINTLMTPILPEGRFITAISLMYSPDTGQARCARAGHPPILVSNAREDIVSEIKPGGMALGIDASVPYDLGTFQLDLGDFFVIYTDGLTEARNLNGEFYGTARMAGLLKHHSRDYGAVKMTKAILDDFSEFCQDRVLVDDVTLIVLKRVL